MNANSVSKHYARLTPEERFRLILAASGRGDEAEKERLVEAAERVRYVMPDHAPFAQAFNELSLLTFIELLAEAAFFAETLARRDEQQYTAEDDGEAAEEAEGGSESEEHRPAWVRLLEVAYAAGYIFRTKAEGWELFCRRLGVPPYLLTEGLPGFERFQRTLGVARDTSYDAAGFLAWLNRVRPRGEPAEKVLRLTAERLADAAERTLRERAKWWAGD